MNEHSFNSYSNWYHYSMMLHYINLNIFSVAFICVAFILPTSRLRPHGPPLELNSLHLDVRQTSESIPRLLCGKTRRYILHESMIKYRPSFEPHQLVFINLKPWRTITMFLIEDLQKLRDLDRNNLTNIQDRCYKEVRNVGMHIYINTVSCIRCPQLIKTLKDLDQNNLMNIQDMLQRSERCIHMILVSYIREWTSIIIVYNDRKGTLFDILRT